MEILAPKPLAKLNRALLRCSRGLSKKQHAKTKSEALQGIKKSRNYQKATLKLNRLHRRISNIRSDFLHKLTSSLVANVDYFSLETLNVKGMMKNSRLAKSLSDVSFYEFNRMLEYKATYNSKKVFRVDRFFPSSKLCSRCGNIKENLALKERIYLCDECGHEIDRDYNASLNLANILKKQVGQVLPEFTLADLTALLNDLKLIK